MGEVVAALSMSPDWLIAAPARRALSAAGCSTIERLPEVGRGTVDEPHGMGPSALETLREPFEAHGLSFEGSA